VSILRIYHQIKWTAIVLGSAAGVVWVVNLPYPMIRLPVAKTAPILLLPSFISMDHHYRGVLAAVEQADQLVNKATANEEAQTRNSNCLVKERVISVNHASVETTTHR